MEYAGSEEEAKKGKCNAVEVALRSRRISIQEHITSQNITEIIL